MAYIPHLLITMQFTVAVGSYGPTQEKNTMEDLLITMENLLITMENDDEIFS